MTRPPLPPFDRDSAAAKVRAAEDAWNSRDPVKVAAAYTPDTAWRNRSEFLSGRAEVEAFLTRKWQAEREYRLIKELWSFDAARIAVRFAYEALGPGGQWFRAYGNENWEFAPDGLMAVRRASINDLPITEDERLFRWPLGPRPEGHPGLSDLGL
jgi:nuclear transport factor 2 (NTF2) superfamily protein